MQSTSQGMGEHGAPNAAGSAPAPSPKPSDGTESCWLHQGGQVPQTQLRLRTANYTVSTFKVPLGNDSIFKKNSDFSILVLNRIWSQSKRKQSLSMR